LWHDGLKQQRFFKTRVEAEAFAREWQERIAAAGVEAAKWSAAELREYRQARALLPDGVSVVDAARAWRRLQAMGKVTTAGPRLREAWSAFFEAKADRSAAYRTQLTSQLEPLLELIGWDVCCGAIQSEAIEQAIEARGGVDETKANRRRMLGTFLAWAVRQYGLPTNPMERVRQWRVKRGSPRFYAVEEMRRLLVAVAEREPRLLPGLALRWAAGLREVEVRRLIRGGWWQEDVRATEQVVFIRPEVAKAAGPDGSGRSRMLDGLPPTVWAWLALPEAERPWWPANLAEVLKPCFEAAGVVPKKNGFRHSFCTYAAAWYRSLETAAAVAGHTTAVLQRHYLGHATHAQAKAYFGLTPEQVCGRRATAKNTEGSAHA